MSNSGIFFANKWFFLRAPKTICKISNSLIEYKGLMRMGEHLPARYREVQQLLLGTLL